MVIAEGTDLLAAATNVLRFFRNESCGKCVPCRVGSTKAHTILAELVESGGGAEDVDERIIELEETMRLTSICGLGQVALGPAISVLGLKRGGTEARPHPRPARPPDQAAGPPATTPPDMTAREGREFFTVKTVSEALTGFRPERRTPVETVELDDALGRVPAEPVAAPHALPGFARATVDGFAVRAADTYGASEGLPSYLDLAGEVRMGRPPEVEVRAGTAVAIATGAPLPPGADAVVKIEHTQAATPELLEVLRPATPGEGMVRADEDAAPGAELVPRRPAVARAGPGNAGRRGNRGAPGPRAPPGGDRLDGRRAGVGAGLADELEIGQVRDSSAPALAALVHEAGGEPHFAGIVPDDREALARTLRATPLEGV